jgi:hypothetical protein
MTQSAERPPWAMPLAEVQFRRGTDAMLVRSLGDIFGILRGDNRRLARGALINRPRRVQAKRPCAV